MKAYEFSYCILRYRRDPDAGEFANIGVALWCPQTRFLGFQACPRYGRLTHFFGDLDVDGYRRLIGYVERQFQELAADLFQTSLFEPAAASVLDLAARVVPIDDGSLVWGALRGGLTPDPNAEVSRLFNRYVGSLNEKTERASRSDKEIFRDVFKRAFDPIAKHIQAYKVVAPRTHHVFGQAWKNGVWNVYEPLSLDLLTPESIEEKAERWLGRGTLLMEAKAPPRIHFLVGKPRIASNIEAFEGACEVLRIVPEAVVIDEDQADEFTVSLQQQVETTARSA
jgi:hypothetical protein